MAHTPHACEYVLIRVAPDPLRADAVTIGVALYEAAAGGFTGVRLTPDFDRVRQLSPHFQPADLEGLEGDLLQRLTTHQPAWLSRAYFLELAKETFSHALQLSEPRAVLTDDPAAELDRLYRQFAAPLILTDAASAARGPRRRVLAHLRRVFEQERVWRHLERNLQAGQWLQTPDRFRFDLHYQAKDETRRHHVIQALPWVAGEAAVKELCFTVERVRRHFGVFDVAAFHDDQPAEEAAYCAQLLAEADIRMLPLTAAAAEAARIRAALRLA
jgi:hypothetical protein